MSLRKTLSLVSEWSKLWMPAMIFLCTILQSTSVWSQEINIRYHKYDSVLWDIADLIYNLDHEKADHAIEKIRPELESHPIYDFMVSLNIVWRTIPEVIPEDVEKLEFHLNAAKDKSKLRLEKDEEDPEGLLFGILAHGLLAQYYNAQNQTFKAVGQARRAYLDVTRGFDFIDRYNEFLFSTGLYNYYREKYPEVYPVYKPFVWVFKKGDLEEGIKQLENAINVTTLARVEAVNYLAYIYLRYENKPGDAVRILKPVIERYPANLYFKTFYTEGQMLLGNLKAGDPIVSDLVSSSRNYYKMCGNVFEGTIKFDSGDYLRAENYFKTALKLGEEFTLVGHGPKSFSHAGLARIYDQQGNVEGAKDEYDKVLDYASHSFLVEEAKKYIKAH